MNGLAEWLTQIWNEDAARAQAAIDDDCGQDGGFEDAFDRLTKGPDAAGPLAFVPRFGEAAAAMIVWQTPRRALARIEADRQILEEHRPIKPPWATMSARGCLRCNSPQIWDGVAENANCRTLCLLALPHADRPGYREEWKP